MRTIVLAAPVLLLLAACEQQKQPQQQQQPEQPPPQLTQAGGAPFSYAKVQTMPKAKDGADGSGCLADSGLLPDGIWFGYARAWTATSVDLDPACMFTGPEAAKAATAHNDESPPPNDFFIANDSAAVRKIPVAATATAFRVTHDKDGNIDNQTTSYADMVTNPGTYNQCPGDGCPVWVAVNGGIATEVSMQYLP
jgi:hypothetical protein